ncbi:hypothetical protein GFK91_00925 [Roseibium aggregatum]|nr:hypothetical protein GFK91_00925 [Roseibium aggregatum]
MVDMIYIPISPAELLDKITILEIKADRISSSERLEHVRFELTSLSEIYDRHMPDSDQVHTWKAQLKRLNESLWTLEDDIRNCDRSQEYRDRFVDLARRIYQTNDKRAALKQEINTELGSRIVEIKSYAAVSSLQKLPLSVQDEHEV